MNRDIKFRGLRTDGKGWVYGYYWRDNTNGKCKITVDLSDDNFTCYEVIPETVGQYTGLKDKDGKEIYEGDIVTVKRGRQDSDEYFEFKELIVFRNGSFQYGSIPLSEWSTNENYFLHQRYHVSYGAHGQGDIYYKDFDIEIIGNIHEHKHLLS